MNDSRQIDYPCNRLGRNTLITLRPWSDWESGVFRTGHDFVCPNAEECGIRRHYGLPPQVVEDWESCEGLVSLKDQGIL